jgi:serine/threonine protein kinase
MDTYINGYRLLGELTTENAGMCRWTFAEKDGRGYFLKQFLRPKYPEQDGPLSPELAERMRRNATACYARRRVFYDRLRECRAGGNVVAEEYFRWGSFYYLVTERVFGPFLSGDQIATLPEDQKRTLLERILYSVMQFHERGIVHSDLKPDNILVAWAESGFREVRIIDFDSGFFRGEAPEEIVGDQVYFSPEALLHNLGRRIPVTEKADLFALALLFHQFWCGALPDFDREKYRYASEALLDGGRLEMRALPVDIRELLRRMLAVSPAVRPTAREAWEQLMETRETALC